MVASAPPQRTLVLTAGVTVAVLVAQQVASKATRDALFLGIWEARWLPWAMLAGAACSLFAAGCLTELMRRIGPGKVLPAALGSSAGLYFVEWSLIASYRPEVAWMLYLHVSMFGATVLSGFWTVYGDLFDPNTAKRLMGRVGAGATLGGIVGAVCAERVAAFGDVASNLSFLGALHIAGAVAIQFLLRVSSAPTSSRERQAPGAGILAKPYLLQIGLLVAVTSAGDALIDFAFKSAASRTLRDEGALVRFFTTFYAGVALAGFVTQSLLSGRSLRRLGIGGTLALLPAAVAASSIVAALLARLATLAALRGVSSVLQISTHRSAYELLYTPLVPSERRASKTLIDISFDRAGDALGSAAILGAIAIVPSFLEEWATITAGILASSGLMLVWRLNRGYVTELAQSLTSGVLDPSLVIVGDATTQRTIAETTLGLNRQKLLEEIDKLQLAKGQARSAGDPSPTLRGPPDKSPENQVLRVLLSEEPQAIDRLLREQTVPTPLAGLVIDLLGKPDLERSALDYLERHAIGLEGTLHDVLLDTELDYALRRRVPRLLRTATTRRSVAALMDALSSEPFDLRYRAGQALVALHENHPHLFQMDEARIFELVLCELQSRPGTGEPVALVDPSKFIDTEAAGWLTHAVRRRLRRRLEHVFSLLCLVRPRAPLEASLRALYGEDLRLRGTAFEYLENILPTDICERLWPHLEVQKVPARMVRPTNEVLEDLLRSSESIPRDRLHLKPPRPRD